MLVKKKEREKRKERKGSSIRYKGRRRIEIRCKIKIIKGPCVIVLVVPEFAVELSSRDFHARMVTTDLDKKILSFFFLSRFREDQEIRSALKE